MARVRVDPTLRRAFLALAGAVEILAVAGCAASAISTRSTRWEHVRRRATPEAFTIEVVERAAIARPYAVIGVVQATAPRWEKGPTDAEMLAALQREARTLGGDALTDLVRNPADKPEWWGPVPFAGRRLHQVSWAALVIAWKE